MIGGSTGSGKSTLAANIVANVAAPDFEVYYLDLENDTAPGDARDIGDRIASAYSKDCPALGHLRAYRRLVDLETDIPRYLAPPAMILTVVAVTVAVVALQNAHAVTVSQPTKYPVETRDGLRGPDVDR